MGSKHTEPGVIGRFFILVFSAGMGFGIPCYAVQKLLQAQSIAELSGQPATLFLLLIVLLLFVACGCGGIWLSLVWKHRTPEELARVQSRPSADRPPISHDALVYRFNNLSKSGAVYVDHTGQMLHFYNCHTPRKFLALTASRWFSCTINELQGAIPFTPPRRYGGQSVESLYVLTTSGKAIISGTETGYEEIRDIIRQLVPVADPQASTEHPLMPLACLFGGIVGLIAGWYLAPSTSNDETMAQYILFGTALGAATSGLLVWFAGRFLRINLAVPMGLSLIGIVIGLMVSEVLRPLTGWSLMSPVVLTIIGAVTGGILGFWGQFKNKTTIRSTKEKKSRRRKSPDDISESDAGPAHDDHQLNTGTHQDTTGAYPSVKGDNSDSGATIVNENKTSSSKKGAGLYDILLDALCCVMVSDGKASHDEKVTIQRILEKVKSPHSAQDVNSSIESFIKQVKERGFSPVLKAVLEETRKFKKRGKQKTLLKAFALVAKSDGSVDEAERKVIARFKAVLQESPPEN